MPPSLEPRVTVGNVLTTLTITLAAFGLWLSFSSALARTEQRVIDLAADVEKNLTRSEIDHDAIVKLQGDLRLLEVKITKDH